MTALPGWVERYRGKPFARGADGPEAFDCYGLIRAVLADQWRVEAPSMDARWHTGSVEALEQALDTGAWSDVDGDPAAGDVVTFWIPGQRELHVGIVVAPSWMLHARLDEGVRTQRLDRMPWAGLRFGPAYRHRDLVVAGGVA